MEYGGDYDIRPMDLEMHRAETSGEKTNKEEPLKYGGVYGTSPMDLEMHEDFKEKEEKTKNTQTRGVTSKRGKKTPSGQGEKTPMSISYGSHQNRTSLLLTAKRGDNVLGR